MKKLLLTAISIIGIISFISCSNDTNDNSTIVPEDKPTEIDATKRADKGGSGVMLQGFTWSSPHSTGDWYSTISENSDEIKNLFEYVWFPPASDCVDTTGNGYLPRELNKLTQANPDKIPFYGSEADLIKAISDISPAKAIADIVINHRCGTTDWGDFTNPDWGVVKKSNYKAICSNDEGFSNKASDMYGARYKGSKDTGESYPAARDIDHTNIDVQNGIVTWMNDVLKNVGFVGWRYDYVKGYAGNYVGYYNQKSSAEFSVGEYYPTTSFSSSVSATWSNLITDWIKETAQKTNNENGQTSRAFDFVLKGIFNDVFGCGNSSSNVAGKGSANYALLNDANIICRRLPGYAVTFVDNHDTGSTQRQWYINPDGIAPAYAYILTHPGYPSVAWYHYFDGEDCPTDSQNQYIGGETVPDTSLTYKQYIKKLVELRSTLNITDMSTINVIQADNTRYAAEVIGNSGSVYVVIGTKAESIPVDYELVVEGSLFQVFSK
ncbi:MAG: hypothetical protein U0K92_01775 [Treponema sp.]|nr:hypothetical protein [Treponema sp.]